MKEKLTKSQNLITITITGLTTVGTYAGGINLARNNPEYHNPIFISTAIISFISPIILNKVTIYTFKKQNLKKENKVKKKGIES